VRLTHGVAVAAAGALLLATQEGAAQSNVQAQATFGASIGVTDNVLQVPDRDPDTPINDTTVFPEWDGLTVLSPGVVLTLERPLSTHTLAYTFGVTFFFVHSEADAYTHNLAYGNLIPLSDTVALNTGIGATLGQQSNFNRTNQPQNAIVQPQNQEPGDDLIVSVFANEGLSKEFSPDWVGTQNLAVSHFRPFDELQGTNWIITNGLTLNRLFEFDIVGGAVGVDYSIFNQIEDPETGEITTPTQHELTTRPALTWQHQFSESIASNLTGGMVHSMDAEAAFTPTPENDDPRHIVQPFAIASIGYGVPAGNAALTYTHDVGPNVFVNSIVLTDSIALAFGLPLGRLPLSWDAGGGFSWVRQVTEDENGDAIFAPAQRIANVDTGLTYVPPAYPSLSIGLRYQFVAQLATELPPELADQGTLPAFTANTILLNFGIVYPDQVEGNAAALTPSPFQSAPTQNPDILRPQQNAEDQRLQEQEEEDLFGSPGE